MHIDILASGNAPYWVYSNENVFGQFINQLDKLFLVYQLDKLFK